MSFVNVTARPVGAATGAGACNAEMTDTASAAAMAVVPARQAAGPPKWFRTLCLMSRILLHGNTERSAGPLPSRWDPVMSAPTGRKLKCFYLSWFVSAHLAGIALNGRRNVNQLAGVVGTFSFRCPRQEPYGLTMNVTSWLSNKPPSWACPRRTYVPGAMNFTWTTHWLFGGIGGGSHPSDQGEFWPSR